MNRSCANGLADLDISPEQRHMQDIATRWRTYITLAFFFGLASGLFEIGFWTTKRGWDCSGSFTTSRVARSG